MNFRTLDLNLLRVFDVVMVERNVTRAAERLSMTQPAVSNALRRLREAIAEELFVPGPTGVTPTPQAQAMWPTVRGALDALRGALDPQGFDPRRDERQFTLAMADATASVLMPHVMQAWAEQQVRSRVRVIGLDTRDPRPLLEQGGADVAVGFFPDVARELAGHGATSVTRLDMLYECRYVCVMRRSHPLARRAQLSLDDYCAAEHLRVNFAGRPQGYVDEALVRLGRERRILITVDSFATAARVVLEHDLLTVLPRSFLPATGSEDQLVFKSMPFELPRIRVGLLWHRRHEHDAAQRWLRHAIGQATRRVSEQLHLVAEAA